MITAIVSQHANTDRAIIARNLAVLRAHDGRRVCLVTTGPAQRDGDWCNERYCAGIRPWVDTRSIGGARMRSSLGSLRPLYNEILVDAGMRDSAESRCALSMARLVVAPVRGDAIDLATQYALIKRLSAARAENPALQVLFVAVGDEDHAAVRAHVARVSGAGLAHTVLHALERGEYGPGRCACDAATRDPEVASAMKALYREVYAPPAPVLPAAFLAASQLGAAHALWR